MTINSLKEHIHFSDIFSNDPINNKKMKEFYTDMIASIVEESLFLFRDDYYKADISLVEYDMCNIDYCIDLFPAVNAGVDIYHNWIHLHLFTIIAANNMTVMTELLDLLSQSGSITTSEAMRKASKWIDTCENEHMVDRYIKDISAQKEIPLVIENNKLYVTWKPDALQKYKYSGYIYDILKLIFLHEYGHWQYARFTDEWKRAYHKQVFYILQKQYSKEYMAANQQIFTAWIEEIIADYIAILVFTKNSRQDSGDKQCTKQCYIAIGLYYGLIAMEELGSGLYKRISSTHPPVSLRQNVAQQLFAGFFSDVLGIPYDMFMENEIQEWYVIQTYFSKIIEEYWGKNNE